MVEAPQAAQKTSPARGRRRTRHTAPGAKVAVEARPGAVAASAQMQEQVRVGGGGAACATGEPQEAQNRAQPLSSAALREQEVGAAGGGGGAAVPQPGQKRWPSRAHCAAGRAGVTGLGADMM
ncbi:MAG: hypothetical protein HS107_14370 [Thermoflexaceae bacterium]|nr:hypothetical protein [Thermoflexaceae bacterium]